MVLVVKNPPAITGDARDVGSIPGLGRLPQGRKWQLTPVFLPGRWTWWATVLGATKNRPQWAAKHTGGIISYTFFLWLVFFLWGLSFWYSPQRIHVKRAHPHLESDTSQFIYKCVSYFQVVCFCVTNNVPKSNLVHASWSTHAWVSRVAKYKTRHPIQFEFWRKQLNTFFFLIFMPHAIGIY